METISLVLLILISFLLRIFLLPLPSFPIDMTDWMAWANHLLSVGPSQFYNTIWSDYLPTYLYVLWFLAFVHQLIPQVPYEILMKLPATLADLALGFLIFKLVREEKSPKYALLAAGLFLFNPLTFFLSSIWGQIDSVFSLLLFLSIYFLIKQKEFPALIFLGISFLIKPWAILFLPLFFLHLRSLKSAFFLLILFTVTVFALFFPFFPYDPIFGLPKLILKSASTYPYTSVFAMNFWGIFGTWKPDSAIFLNLSHQTWGFLLLCGGVILALISFLKNKRAPAIYLGASLISLAIFMFPTRVHERWLYPFFPFFLVWAALINGFKLWLVYILFSTIHFLNLYFVYTYYNPNFLKIGRISEFIGNKFSLFSFLSVCLYVLVLFLSFKLKKDEKD